MNDLELWLEEFSPDVLRKIKAKRRGKVIRIVLLDLLLIVGVYMSRSAFEGKPFELPLYVAVGALILLMPIFVTPCAVLFRKPWIGTVERCEINSQSIVGRRASVRYYGRRAAVSTYRVNEVVYAFYDVVDERGKHHEIALPSKYVHCFLKGDRIAVFAELEYPINLTEHKGGAALCPLCASILHYAHKEQCLCCGCRFERRGML